MSLSTVLFSFDGRTRRAPYWRFNVAVTVCAVLLAIALHGMSRGLDARPTYLWTTFFLASLYPSTAVAVRRLNDIGWSRLLAYGLAEVSAPLSLYEQFQPFGPILSGSAGNIVVWLLLLTGAVAAIVIGCVRGTGERRADEPNPRAVPA
jgi:uncharacterized membrane protein YhaH (DUF805 family)